MNLSKHVRFQLLKGIAKKWVSTHLSTEIGSSDIPSILAITGHCSYAVRANNQQIVYLQQNRFNLKLI